MNSPAIRLKRPPVVLVHGLWGCGNKTGCGNNPYAWTDFETKLNSKQQFDITAVDYFEQGIVRGISDFVVETKYNKALGEAAKSSKAKGYASSKVDVIGHSMGGLVTRQYCFDHSTNCQNRIRRVITIATPHFGSELADLLLVYRNDIDNNSNSFPAQELCKENLDTFINGGKLIIDVGLFNVGIPKKITSHPIRGGAIDDLATGSLPNFIDSTTTQGRWNQLPSLSQSLSAHTIVGLLSIEEDGVNMEDGKDMEIWGLWKFILKPCGFTLTNVFGDEYELNDRIVKRSSQQDGLSSQFTTLVTGEDHLTVRNSQETIDKIKRLLDAQSSDGLFSQ